MWHALRAELAYFRPWLLGGFGLAAGVVTLVSVIFWLVGEDGPTSSEAAGIRGVFAMMAPLVVGFIVQAYRSEERRARLLLAGPLTPRQMAAVTVLLPVVLLGFGVLAAGLAVGASFLATGTLELGSLHMTGYVGGLMFLMLMMGLLVQESTAAHRQGRRRPAAVGWGVFVVAVLALAALSAAAFVIQGPWTWISLHLANLIVALGAMAAGAALYVSRTDFTR